MTGLTEEEIRRKYAPYGELILINIPDGTTVMKDEEGNVMFHEKDVFDAFDRLKRICEVF